MTYIFFTMFCGLMTPYIEHSLILENVVELSNTRECGRTLYVGLASAVPPTNTKLPVNIFTNPTQEPLYEDLPV